MQNARVRKILLQGYTKVERSREDFENLKCEVLPDGQNEERNEREQNFYFFDLS